MPPLRLHPEHAAPARSITTHEGRFLSLEDMRAQLALNGPIDECLVHMKIGHDAGDDLRTIMRNTLASFLIGCAGDWERLEREVDGGAE